MSSISRDLQTEDDRLFISQDLQTEDGKEEARIW